MSKPWKGCIPTEVFVCVDKESDIPTIFNHPPQLVDICEYLGGAKYPTLDKQVVFMWMWIPNQQRFSFRTTILHHREIFGNKLQFLGIREFTFWRCYLMVQLNVHA
jgi:hypothetical protein